MPVMKPASAEELARRGVGVSKPEPAPKPKLVPKPKLAKKPAVKKEPAQTKEG